MIRLRGKVLCLDWDRRSLRIVVAKVGGGAMALEDAHAHRIPPTVDPDDAAAMGAFVAQMLQRHGLRHKRVILDVPSDKAIQYRLTLPPTPAHELAAAVRFQAQKELPYPLDEAVIDYVVMQRDGGNRATEVSLVAVRRETLARLRATCEAAGLTPARIGLRPYANLMSAIHLPGMQDRRVLLVDVGPTATEIDIGQGHRLAFSRAASVNVPVRTSDLVTDDSRVSSKIIQMENETPDEGQEAAVAALLVEIVRTLQVYRATETNSVIDQIIIAGGTGVETRLREAVEQRFGLPTALFDPTGPLGAPPADAPKLRSFSAALGLAWGLGREGLLELDFLNPKKPVAARAALKRRLRFAATAAAVLLVAAGGFGAKYYWDGKRQLKGLQQDVDKLEKQVKESRQVRNRVEEADEWSGQAVWIDDLLALTRAASGFEKPETPATAPAGAAAPRAETVKVEAGKNMLVQSITFNKSLITLKVLANNGAVAPAFVEKLNAVEVKGKQPYLAEYSGWNPAGGDPTFRGSVDVTVRLRDLSNFLSEAEIKKRAQAREKRLKDF